MRIGNTEISSLTDEQRQRIQRNRQKYDGNNQVHAALNRCGTVCHNHL